MDNHRFQILGIAGSLRRHSYNRALLDAAQHLMSDTVPIELFDLLPIPFYNEDLEAEETPVAVRMLRHRIAAADALLIATPEYNYAMPGVLKNALDWASRPAEDSVLRYKPVALIGASPSVYGTVRAQMMLRQVLLGTGSYVLTEPEMMVARAHEQFDALGKLQDKDTQERLRRLVDALVNWTQRLHGSE